MVDARYTSVHMQMLSKSKRFLMLDFTFLDQTQDRFPYSRKPND